MAIPIKTLIGTEETRNQSRDQNIGFNTHVCLPAIVQSFDSVKRTIEAQPTIRERYIPEDGSITFVQYPLLINVPVVFPSSGGFHIQFPINKGDECLILFSDLAIDNWWLNGNIQNPIEQRRHDLSDGMAIFGIQNQNKIQQEEKRKAVSGSLSMFNSKNGTGIYIGQKGITLRYYEIDPETGQEVEKSTKWGI